MQKALEQSNERSALLEELLQQAKNEKSPSPELLLRIHQVNKECDELLERYLEQYRAYYN